MRRSILGTALLLALLLPTSALADTGPGGPEPAPPVSDGMTIRVDGVHLLANVAVRFDATIRCASKPAGTTWDGLSITGWVKQRASRSIAFGSSSVVLDPARYCDGRLHRIVVYVSADTSGRPFKSYVAGVALEGFASWFAGGESEEWTMGFHHASTGWLVMRLRRD